MLVILEENAIATVPGAQESWRVVKTCSTINWGEGQTYQPDVGELHE